MYMYISDSCVEPKKNRVEGESTYVLLVLAGQLFFDYIFAFLFFLPFLLLLLFRLSRGWWRMVYRRTGVVDIMMFDDNIMFTKNNILYNT